MAILLQRANFNGKNGTQFFLDLYYDLLGQNQTANTSSVRYYAYVGSIGGYSGSGSTASVYINGQRVGGFSSIGASSNTLIGTLDTTIGHNTEGVGVASYSATADTNWTLGDASLSGSFNLPTIPRSDKITGPSSVVIGQTYTISITQNSSSFTHNIRYSFGDLSGTIATGFGSSCSWKVPDTFYAKIPNAKSGTGTLYCDTYSGGSLIGTTSISFTASVDENVVRPTHSFSYTTSDSISNTLTGSQTGVIKGVSSISYKITGSAKYSSSISKYYLSTDKSYTEVQSTGTVSNVPTNKYYVSVQDSRGIRSTQTEQTLSPFVDYTMLAITDLSFERENELSSNVYMNLKGNYFNGNFGATNNSLAVKMFFRKKGETSWGSVIDISSYAVISGNSFSFENQLVGDSFSYEESYEFRIVLQDKVFTDASIYKEITLTNGIALLDIGENDILFHGKKLVDFIEEKVRMNVDLVYPVGSIYLSVNATNPTQLFGGTWEQWGKGRVPVGIDTNNSNFNTIEKTGGEETHTLNINETPSHSHNFQGGSGLFTRPDMGVKGLGAGGYWVEGVGTLLEVGYTGGDQPHNNLQPYITCYMWKRTA